MSDPWIHRLSEYIDDELLAPEREELETHLRACRTCSTTLAELTVVVEQAGRLEDHFPPRDLWPGIARGLEPEAEAVERPVLHHPSPAPARLALSPRQILAAGVAVMMISAGLGWWGARWSGAPSPRPRVAQETPAPEMSPAEASLDDLAHAIAQYQLSIEQLQDQLRTQVDNLDPETRETIMRNLRSIDDAIFESRKALTRNPDSEYLQTHLAASIQRKVRLLEQANSLASNEI